MRQFAQKGYRIEQLSRDAKLIYSGFLLFGLAGLALSVVYYSSLIGSKPIDGAKTYYAGDVGGSEPSDGMGPLDAPLDLGLEEGVLLEGGVEITLADSDGPAMELPEEDFAAPSGPIIVPMTTRKLMEVTHFHLFTLPVFLLIIAHVFMLCRMHPRLKTAAIMSGTLSLGVHIAAPWIVFEGGSSWAWVMPVSGTWMLVSMVFLIAWPAWAMWLSKPPPRAERNRPQAPRNEPAVDGAVSPQARSACPQALR